MSIVDLYNKINGSLNQNIKTQDSIIQEESDVFEFITNEAMFGKLQCYNKDKILLKQSENNTEVVLIKDFKGYLADFGYKGNFQELVDDVKKTQAVYCEQNSPLDYALRYRLLIAVWLATGNQMDKL